MISGGTRHGCNVANYSNSHRESLSESHRPVARRCHRRARVYNRCASNLRPIPKYCHAFHTNRKHWAQKTLPARYCARPTGWNNLYNWPD